MNNDDAIEERQRNQLRDRLQREQEIDDLRWLMGNVQGRRVMHRLLLMSGLYRKSYTGNSETFFREGQRDIGLKLLAEVNTHCPKSFVTMLEEQQNDDRDPNHRAD